MNYAGKERFLCLEMASALPRPNRRSCILGWVSHLLGRGSPARTKQGVCSFTRVLYSSAAPDAHLLCDSRYLWKRRHIAGHWESLEERDSRLTACSLKRDQVWPLITHCHLLSLLTVWLPCSLSLPDCDNITPSMSNYLKHYP